MCVLTQVTAARVNALFCRCALAESLIFLSFLCPSHVSRSARRRAKDAKHALWFEMATHTCLNSLLSTCLRSAATTTHSPFGPSSPRLVKCAIDASGNQTTTLYLFHSQHIRFIPLPLALWLRTLTTNNPCVPSALVLSSTL